MLKVDDIPGTYRIVYELYRNREPDDSGGDAPQGGKHFQRVQHHSVAATLRSISALRKQLRLRRICSIPRQILRGASYRSRIPVINR
jgi:hypothetical protein